MPFGKREKDTGEAPVPPTRFGIMGDPDAHDDHKKVNPMAPEIVNEARSAHDDANGDDNDDKQGKE